MIHDYLLMTNWEIMRIHDNINKFKVPYIYYIHKYHIPNIIMLNLLLLNTKFWLAEYLSLKKLYRENHQILHLLFSEHQVVPILFKRDTQFRLHMQRLVSSVVRAPDYSKLWGGRRFKSFTSRKYFFTYFTMKWSVSSSIEL